MNVWLIPVNLQFDVWLTEWRANLRATFENNEVIDLVAEGLQTHEVQMLVCSEYRNVLWITVLMEGELKVRLAIDVNGKPITLETEGSNARELIRILADEI